MISSLQAKQSDKFPRSVNPTQKSQMRASIILTEPEYLLEGYVERDVFVLGEIHGVPISVDITNRMAILPIIDEARKNKKLPWRTQAKHRASISLSAYNIKLISQKGAILMRAAVHEIAGMSYIRDDDEHILIIKKGDPKKKECTLVVINCTKMSEAEEICSILDQIFQLVYTEATMAHLDNAIGAGEEGIHLMPLMEELDGENRGVDLVETGSYPNQFGIPGPEEYLPTPPVDTPSKSEDKPAPPPDSKQQDLNVVAEEIVQRYMERLHSLLTPNELMQFALLLRQYRSGMQVNEFCDKLTTLYGKKRYFLLPDMRAFIPEEDKTFFEAFLVECGQGNMRTSRD